MPKATSGCYIAVVILICCLFECNGQQRCLHNQFRCLDGQCLNTEALCNSRRDCSGGEDEPKSGAWSCRSQILTKDKCDPASQFRCRFGGCVPRTSLCNGVIDCWGGSDESQEVCNGKTSAPLPNNIAPQQIQTRPPRPPAARPKPPPVQTNPAPGSGIYGTADRGSIPSLGATGSCGPISEDQSKGFKVRCETRNGQELRCEDVPEGGTAIYSCRNPFFFPTDNLIIETTRSCQNSRWSNLNARFGCEAECGVASAEQATFIVGGTTAEEGRWPWVAAMYELSSRSNTWEFICGASLISQKAIITAAHCVVRGNTGQSKPYNTLKIVLGKYYRKYNPNLKSNIEQEFGVAEVYVNPDYNAIALKSDVAVVKLSRTVIINEYVRPVCLPGPRDYIDSGAVGMLVGWGRGDNNQFKEKLQQAQLPFVPSGSCIDAHPQFARLVQKGTFCAGYLNGTSACDGDSGGPLVFRDKYVRGKYILHGVVSAGIASSDGRSGCNPNYYAVFTDVGYSEIRNWIGRVVSNYFRPY